MADLTLEDKLVACLGEAIVAQHDGMSLWAEDPIDDAMTVDGDLNLREVAVKLQQQFRIES